MIIDFVALSVVGLLVIGLTSTDFVLETKVLSRLLVSDFNKRHFLIRSFGRFYEEVGFVGPEAKNILSRILLQSPQNRGEFFETFCGDCSDDEDFDINEEAIERDSYFVRLARVITVVVINHRIADLCRITESNLMKRLEDVLQKWTFEELDSLFDSEMPLIYNYVPGKSIESLCPFDGISVLARQLRRLWTLLSKLPIVEPIFQQFFLDRLAEATLKENEFENVSGDDTEILQSENIVLQDPEIVASIASSSLLPKATTLSLIYPLREENDENSLNFLKTESRQVVAATGKELVEFFPVLIGTNSKMKVRMKRPYKDIRRLATCPTDPMLYAAGSSIGEVFLFEFACDTCVMLLSAKDAPARVTCLTFSASGSRLATSDELGNIRIWIVDQAVVQKQGVSPVQKFNVGRDIFSISFFLGSSYLLTAGHYKAVKGRAVCLWDTLTRQYLQPKNHWDLAELNYQASALAVSNIFKTIIVGGREGGICFISSEDFKLSSTLKFVSQVKCLQLSQNEEILAAGSVDGSIRIISTSQSLIFVTLRNEHPRPSVFKNHASGVMGISFCDEILLSCGADGSIKKRHLPSLLASHQEAEVQPEAEAC